MFKPNYIKQDLVNKTKKKLARKKVAKNTRKIQRNK